MRGFAKAGARFTLISCALAPVGAAAQDRPAAPDVIGRTRLSAVQEAPRLFAIPAPEARFDPLQQILAEQAAESPTLDEFFPPPVPPAAGRTSSTLLQMPP